MPFVHTLFELHCIYSKQISVIIECARATARVHLVCMWFVDSLALKMQVRMLNVTLKKRPTTINSIKNDQSLNIFVCAKLAISYYFFLSFSATAYDSIAFICRRIFDFSFCCSWMLLAMWARAWARAYILFVSRNCIICGTHTLNKNAYSRAKSSVCLT